MTRFAPIVVAILLAGCDGLPRSEASAPGVASLASAPLPSPSAVASVPADPAVDPILATASVTCGGPPFPVEMLSRSEEAQDADDPAAAALRALFAMPEASDFLPRTGWVLALREEDLAFYVAETPAGSEVPFVHAELERRDGGWQPAGFGQCWPQADVGPGLGLAEFRVAPHEELASDTTEIAVLVTERACNSGGDARGRIVRPAIIETAESVTVIFGVVPRGGDHTCQGNPETPFLLQLPEPLGDRALLDGSSVPPRDATACPEPAIYP